MPRFIKSIFGASEKDTVPVNQYEGFQSNSAVVMRDRRGTRKAEIPEADTKGFNGGDDPLAIYKPSGAKHVDPSKAMDNFTGWTFAAVNAIASEIANIQWRLYQVKGDDHEEQEDHPILEADACLPHSGAVCRFANDRCDEGWFSDHCPGRF